VLCVDDDAVMLDITTRMIDSEYEVFAASSGEEALGLIEKSPSIDVVVSDHRMPGLSGAQFLQLVRDKQPLMVRILLTAERDLAATVAAMNQADLFRFLVKPTSRDALLETLAAAVIQHQLQLAERELLRETLIGAVRALGDVLALANPTAFGRVSRVQELALAVAKQLNLSEHWPLELAALASQWGNIVLPEETQRRLHAGKHLSPAECDQVARSARAAEGLLARIPRLGPVVEILAQLGNHARAPESLPAKIIKAVSVYEVLERTSESRDAALQRLADQAQDLDPAVLRALTAALALGPSPHEALEVPIGSIREDMMLAQDLTASGVVLAATGCRVSQSLLARLANVHPSSLPGAIRVRAGSARLAE
jgi:response regulator RpfG family c-di-GMP phosphodiesterase